MKKPNPLRRLARWLVRLMLRVGLFPTSSRAETDTMGDWKRLMAEKDDPKPGLVLPDPNAPHADLIRRMRLYAQNGAKALAPMLDRPLPIDVDADANAIQTMADDAWETSDGDREACAILTECRQPNAWRWDSTIIAAIHAAYNSPWTVVDGEVYEYETERKRRLVQ